MQKKSIISILSVTMALIVASLALVFTVGPLYADEGNTIYVFDRWDDFVIDENFVLVGLSDSAVSELIDSQGGRYTKYGLLFDDDSFEVHIKVPEDVKELKDSGVFFDLHNFITVLELPNSLTNIRHHSLSDLKITTITIPENVTEISYDAFNNNYYLNEVIFAENSKLTTIGSRAFDTCRSLTTITIPASVEEIGENAFQNCEKLSQIYCEASAKPAGWDEAWVNNDYWDEESEEWVETNVTFGYVNPNANQNNEPEDPTDPNENNNQENNGTENQNTTEPEQPANNEQPENKVNVAAVAGGTAGGVAGLGTIGTIIGVVVGKKRRK